MSTHKFVALEQPGLAAVWHDQYKNQPGGEATLQQKIDIQEGRAVLPAGARFRLDSNPTFDPLITSGKREEAGDAFVPYPTWLFELIDKDGNVVKSGELGEGSYAIDDFVSLQSPERPDGFYQLSLGYAPIFEWSNTELHGGKLRITPRVGGLVAPAKLLPVGYIK